LLFNKRERFIVGILIIIALVLALMRYLQIRDALNLYRRGELIRVIDETPPQH
jgi:hypothetical protein